MDAWLLENFINFPSVTRSTRARARARAKTRRGARARLLVQTFVPRERGKIAPKIICLGPAHSPPPPSGWAAAAAAAAALRLCTRARAQTNTCAPQSERATCARDCDFR